MEINNKDEIKEKVIAKLREIPDLELPISIYDLGLIYNIALEENEAGLYADIEMTLINSRCSSTKSLNEKIKSYVVSIDEVNECNVRLVYSPKWDVTKITPEGLAKLREAGNKDN